MNYPTTAAASESAPAAATLAPCAEYLRLLSIAGSDSGGGAGIQADLKTFHQFGVFGTSVVVAITAQNTRGVRAVETVPESMVAAQHRLLGDISHESAGTETAKSLHGWTGDHCK